MPGIRKFVREDAPAVAAMYERLFRSGSSVAPAGLIAYFTRIFIDNPMACDDACSLVYEDSSGQIIGFIGVQFRPFVFDGKPIRVLVSGPLFIDDQAGAKGTGLLLLRELVKMPHDVLLTDGATRGMREIWTRVVGASNELGAMQWELVFRPLELRLRHLARHPRFTKLPILIRALRPICRILDSSIHAWVTRQIRKPPRTIISEDLTAETAREFLSVLSESHRFHADYDTKSFAWIFDELSNVKSYGNLQKLLLRDEQHNPVGAIIFYSKAFEVSRLVYFAARPNWGLDTLLFLLNKTDQNKSLSIKARAEPALTCHLADFRSRITYGELFSLIKADPEVYAALFAGNASLTRLDGEWWLGLYREDFSE